MRNATDRIWILRSVLLLIAIGLAIYANSINNSFTFDDLTYLKGKVVFTSFQNVNLLISPDYFKIFREVTYRPLMMLSFFVDYKLWGWNPMGYHITNIILHISNAMLIFTFFYMALSSCKNKRIPLIASLASSILFLVHPVNSEVANGISFRNDSIQLFFMLTAFILYVLSKRSIGLKRYSLVLLSGISVITGGLAKEWALFALPYMIMMDLFEWIGGSSGKKFLLYFKDRVLSYLCLAGIALIGILNYFHFISYQRSFTLSRALAVPAIETIFRSRMEYFYLYIKSTLLPFNIPIDYIAMQQSGAINEYSIFTLVSVLLALVLVIFFCKKAPAISFGILWWLIPVSALTVVSTQIYAMRLLYFPMVGILLAVGYIISVAATNSRFRLPTVALFIAVSLIFSIQTVRHNSAWRNSVTLWEYQVSANPRSADAHSALGSAYETAGLSDKAVAEYEKALSLDANCISALNNIGALYLNKGNPQKAIPYFDKAISVAPSGPSAHFNLANAYVKSNRIDEAINTYRRVPKNSPLYARSLQNIGDIYIRKGMFEDAILVLNNAMEADPMSAQAHYLTASAHIQLRKFDEAIAEFKKAIALKPDFIAAYNDLGGTYFLKEDFREARSTWEALLKRDPDNVRVINNLRLIDTLSK